MGKRITYNLPGLSPAGAMTPDLVKAGEMFFTSAVRGVDLQTGDMPDDPAEQFINAWHNLKALVEGADIGTDGAIEGADWTQAPPDDPLLLVACAGA